MSFIAVIPARYASTRLPGKPLAMIHGKPMVQYVWERACASDAARVVVATDDERIQEVCGGFGAHCLMTRGDHPSGTDRLAEVAQQLALDDDQLLVNVQGDEPMIPADVINQVARNLAACDHASIATLCEPISEVAQLVDPNVVKVVADRAGLALYFSRACIPWPRGQRVPESAQAAVHAPMPAGHWYRHLGLYAYRVAFLRRYQNWEPAPLERTESLEQLRALFEGERIHVEPACAPVPGGIDTPEDLAALRALLAGKISSAAALR